MAIVECGLPNEWEASRLSAWLPSSLLQSYNAAGSLWTLGGSEDYEETPFDSFVSGLLFRTDAFVFCYIRILAVPWPVLSKFEGVGMVNHDSHFA
jgi:hypothetical protein